MAAKDRTVRLGTRGSVLALWQAHMVAARLEALGFATELVTIRTTGDRITDVPVARMGAVGVFTNDVDRQLAEGRIDIAVHSLKDLPTETPMGIEVAAIGVREDPRDALVGRGPLSWSDLPSKAVIATSSPRRRAQLLRARPDLRVIEMRGNVDTRLASLDRRSDVTATVLAVAGLLRLGLGHRIGERLSPALILPAPGQGALAVTARSDDSDVAALLARAIHDERTALAVTAERTVLRAVGAGCHAPLGTLAEWTDAGGARCLQLTARLCSPDGAVAIETQASRVIETTTDARTLGEAVARELMTRGERHLVDGA